MATKTSALTPERLLAKAAGLHGPYREGAKRQAYLLVKESMPAIWDWIERGVLAAPAGKRRDTLTAILSTASPSELAEKENVGFNLWLWNECMGAETPGRFIFYRCLRCQSMRTYRGVCRGPCKCKSTQHMNWGNEFETKEALAALVAGY